MNQQLENLEKVVRSYGDALAGKPFVLHVPEWEMDLHFWPETLEERQARMKYDGYEYTVAELLQRAKDAKGNLMFGIDQLPVWMTKADPKVVTRVCNEMRKATFGVKQALGESTQTPS